MNAEMLDGRLPLRGVRVLELSQIMAGPICGLMLADLGADVIKIEKFPAGDDARAFNNSGAPGEMPASFQMINRGKKSVALDIRTDAGRQALLRMVRKTDVLTENFRPGTLQRLGLGPDVLMRENPALICVSVSGYGAKGDLQSRGGFDLVLQAFSGLISVTGEPGRGGVKPGVPIADINAGVLATLGVLAAYIHRLRSGKGQWVQTSLLQASVQQLYWYAALFFSSGQLPERLGTAHPIIAPYQTYQCADGELALGGGNDSIWKRIVQIVGKPEWEIDPSFRSPKDRLDNREKLAACLNAVLVKRTRAEWERDFLAAGVPCGPVQTVDEALLHPQTRSLDMVIDVADANGGNARAIGLPILFDGSNHPARSAAPRLGQDTQTVLRELGFSGDEITALKNAGASWDGLEGHPQAPGTVEHTT